MINVNSQKQVILRSKTFDRFRNYQSITIEMKEFFDRTRKQVIAMIEPDELLVVHPIGRGAVMRNDG